jgi:hypothetical protein
MLNDGIPHFPHPELACTSNSCPVWVHYPKELLRRPCTEAGLDQDRLPEEPRLHAHPCAGGKSELEEAQEREHADPRNGHVIFQEVFFFCTVKNLGDVPGTGCIHVETVVDRDSGFAFAKVYSAKNAMNAVDILASRVVPFFQRQGIAIKEIHTRKTGEYCGLLPVHPFETFLATTHIQHLPMDQSSQSNIYLCEQFYRFLQKEFFQPALRRKFHMSLDELQKGLDAFVEAYNTARMNHEQKINEGPHPSANFPVDL